MKKSTIVIRVLIFIVVLALSGFGAYLLTPNASIKVQQKQKEEPEFGEKMVLKSLPSFLNEIYSYK